MNTISWGDLLAPWVQIIVPVIVAFVMALLTYLTVLLKQRTGISIEQAHMKTLQTALENAAGKVVMILGTKLKDAKFDAKHPAIKQAVEYINQSAADAVKNFALSPEQLAEKVIAKIGIVTAADPEARPRDVTPPPPDPGKGG